MIKYFRKIRQQLLTQNRFSKYLLYAVGEILLVMVGILLALQVNNWNEDKKLKVKKESYKTSLIEDISKDTIQLINDINYVQKDYENLNNISRKISNTNIDVDSIICIYRKEFVPFMMGTNNFNRKTIEGLLASGDISLFEDDLYSDLMSYNDLQEEVEGDIALEFSIYFNYLTLSKLAFPDKYNRIRGKHLNAIWDSINQNEFMRSFNNLLTSKMTGDSIMTAKRKDLLRASRLILKNLSYDD